MHKTVNSLKKEYKEEYSKRFAENLQDLCLALILKVNKKLRSFDKKQANKISNK